MQIQLVVQGYSPKLIDTQAEFLACAKHLQKHSEFVFDTEFDDNRFRKGHHLCLVQICTEKDCYLIDTIALSNNFNNPERLQPLWDLFHDPKIAKVGFECSSDLVILRSYQCLPKNIVDVAAMMRLVGEQNFSLQRALAARMDKHLDKSKQLHNWYKRPLGLDVQKYAVEDVIYLLPLRAILEKELHAKNRFDWWKEELQHPKPANTPRFPPPPDPSAPVATETEASAEAAPAEETTEATAFVSRVSRRISDARKEKLQAIKKHIGETQDLAIASLCLNTTNIKLLAYGYMRWADYYLPYRLALIRLAAQDLAIDISDME